jgi:cell wall-associated NlpC family hydrolase
MTRWTRRTAALAAAALAAGGLMALAAPTAVAETPQQRAAALAAAVRSLQARAEVASEAYDQAQSQLVVVTAQRFAAERAVTTAQTQVQASAAADQSTVSGLYELGGPAVLYTSVLTSGGDPDTVQTGLIAAQRVLGADRQAMTAAGAQSDAAVIAQQHAEALATEQLTLEGAAADAQQQVLQDLAHTQQLLSSADAQVAAIEQADELQVEANDHAEFLRQQALAQAGDGPYASQLAGAPPASSPVAAAALAAAEALEGHPYLWGGTGPIGYDCSGTTQAAYAVAGVHLPRTAAEQYGSGPHVPLAYLEPGDLLFWATDPSDPTTIHHVAIYAGNGLMVSADHTGDTVRLQPVWWDGYAGATRPSI